MQDGVHDRVVMHRLAQDSESEFLALRDENGVTVDLCSYFIFPGTKFTLEVVEL